MSKYTNANWDHYKLAGRERPGDAVPHEGRAGASRAPKATPTRL